MGTGFFKGVVIVGFLSCGLAEPLFVQGDATQGLIALLLYCTIVIECPLFVKLRYRRVMIRRITGPETEQSRAREN